MATVLCVSCLSGGSGKTTSALNIGTMLSASGRTLLCDFDPQGNLSQWLGWSDLSDHATVAETLLPKDRTPISEVILQPQNEDRRGALNLVPSDYSLSRAADTITMEPGREFFLRRSLKDVRDDYDFIVIDTPPAKGVLTYCAVLASDLLLIPTGCTNKGVVGAVNTVIMLKELDDLGLEVPEIIGILPTRDKWSGANRTKLCRAALDALTQSLPEIHCFSPLKESTLVQQTNNVGWSLQEADQKKLAKPYTEILKIVKDKK